MRSVRYAARAKTVRKGERKVSMNGGNRGETRSVGVGELQLGKAALVLGPPNPNKPLYQFVKPDPIGDSLPAFDSVSWLDTAKANVSWDSVSWTDVSWADVSWNDTSYEDAAEGETGGDPNGYELTPELAAGIMADPELAPEEGTCRQPSRSRSPSNPRFTDGRDG